MRLYRWMVSLVEVEKTRQLLNFLYVFYKAGLQSFPVPRAPQETLPYRSRSTSQLFPTISARIKRNLSRSHTPCRFQLSLRSSTPEPGTMSQESTLRWIGWRSTPSTSTNAEIGVKMNATGSVFPVDSINCDHSFHQPNIHDH